jgi:UDP-glucuronate 4-epimerase
MHATVDHRAHLPEDAADLVAAVSPAVIFHLACPVVLTDGDDVERQLRSGIVDATEALGHAASRHRARLVHVSSCAVYEDDRAPFSEAQTPHPLSPYGRLKLEAEQAAAAVADLSLCLVRPFRTYGPGCETGLVADVCRAAVTGATVSLTDGRQVREWNFVDTIATGIIAAGAHPAAVGQTINIGGGDRVSVGALARRIVALASAPASVLSIGTAARRPGETDRFWGDHRRAEHRWGPLPHVAIDAGLEQTIAWHKAQRECGT